MTLTKHIAIYLSLCLSALAGSVPAMAQPGGKASAAGSTSVTLVEPIAVRAERELAFGWMDSARSPTVSVRPVEEVQEGGASAAKFEVTGTPLRSYQISIQPEVRARGLKSGFELPVTAISSFSANLGSSGSTGKLDAQGADTVYVGGTVSLEKGMPSDTYIAEVQIFVAYN